MALNTATYTYKQWPLVGQTFSHFLNKVALDASFNRYACWKENSGSEFVRNVVIGFAPSPIIIANLKNCLDLCNEGTIQYNYFNSWIKKGYEFLAIDGNNRTTSIRKYLNNEIYMAPGEINLPNTGAIKIDKSNGLFKTHPLVLKEYIENNVTVTICEYVLSNREQVSELFCSVNEGMALKDQEKRNAILVPIADEIREITAKFEPGNKIFKNNKHYVFDDLMVKLAVIFSHGPSNGFTQKDAYDAYTDNSTVYQSWVKKPGMNGKTMVEHVNRLAKLYTGVKLNGSTIINLFMALYSINANKSKVSDDAKFFDWFMSTESKRIADKTILVSNKKGDFTYDGLNSGTQKVDLEARYRVIENDLKTCPFISRQIEKDPNRIFTRTQRYEAWERQGGKTPSGEIIPESEIYDTDKWHADHVVPFSLGGSTSIENCRLISKEENLRKGNRVTG